MCDDGFNQNAADAICSLMGYPNTGSEWTSGEVKWSIQTIYSITLDDVNCQTSSWSSCTYSETDNCGHGQDVFLTCFGSDSGAVNTRLIRICIIFLFTLLLNERLKQLKLNDNTGAGDPT